MRPVLNLRFEDSWSVTSAAFNRTLIASQISNHYWSSPTLIAPRGKLLFWRFKTVFTTASDKGALASGTKLSVTPVSVTCPHRFKTEPCTGGLRPLHCLLLISGVYEGRAVDRISYKCLWLLPLHLSMAVLLLFKLVTLLDAEGTCPKSCVCQEIK